jgi:hypothetical protein
MTPDTVRGPKKPKLTAPATEMADQVRRQWLAARRRGVVIVSGDWDVLEVPR